MNSDKIFRFWKYFTLISLILAIISMLFRQEMGVKTGPIFRTIGNKIKSSISTKIPSSENIDIKKGLSEGVNVIQDERILNDKTEDSEFNDVLNNPQLENYLKFIEKYPSSLKKNELITKVISTDPNLPSQNYWSHIEKNEEGYWEFYYKDFVWLVWIPGKIRMESNPELKNGEEQTIQRDTEGETKGFWMGKYEVTVEQYKSYCEKNNMDFSDSIFYGDMGTNPIRNISWNEATRFCEWLGCRLPTESEWERAARGEQSFTNYPWGEIFDPTFCNINSNTVEKIGSFKNNDFGLFDMIGNVAEWLQDWYSEDILSLNKQELYKVIRGGSFQSKPTEVLLQKRNYMFPSYKGESFGFRVAMD